MARFEGQIEVGDLAKFEAAAERLLSLSHPEAGTGDVIVCLNSPGSNRLEDTKIAAFFEDKWIGTVIDDGDSCLSVCSIIFMLGTPAYVEDVSVNRKNARQRAPRLSSARILLARIRRVSERLIGDTPFNCSVSEFQALRVVHVENFANVRSEAAYDAEVVAQAPKYLAMQAARCGARLVGDAARRATCRAACEGFDTCANDRIRLRPGRVIGTPPLPAWMRT